MSLVARSKQYGFREQVRVWCRSDIAVGRWKAVNCRDNAIARLPHTSVTLSRIVQWQSALSQTHRGSLHSVCLSRSRRVYVVCTLHRGARGPGGTRRTFISRCCFFAFFRQRQPIIVFVLSPPYAGGIWKRAAMTCRRSWKTLCDKSWDTEGPEQSNRLILGFCKLTWEWLTCVLWPNTAVRVSQKDRERHEKKKNRLGSDVANSFVARHKTTRLLSSWKVAHPRVGGGAAMSLGTWQRSPGSRSFLFNHEETTVSPKTGLCT